MPQSKEYGATLARGPGIWETLKEMLPGRGRPFDWVQVEVSSRCPGRCRYCPRHVWRRDWNARDMTLDTFQRLWPLMRKTTRVHLQGWGEPLDHPQFFEMAALARRAGCSVSTTTSGLPMNTELAAKLVESGLDIIAFSLAGTDSESNRVRAGIAFDRVCEAVTLLQRERRRRGGVHLEIHFAYMLLASNMPAIRGLPQLMRRLGVHAAVVGRLDYIYIPEPVLAGEAIAAEDVQKRTHLDALLALTGDEVRRLGFDFHDRLAMSSPPGSSCSENIQRSLFVSAGGDVSPCVYTNIPSPQANDGRRVFGNIEATDPLAIWADPAYRSFRQALALGPPDRVCRQCAKRGRAD